MENLSLNVRNDSIPHHTKYKYPYLNLSGTGINITATPYLFLDQVSAPLGHVSTTRIISAVAAPCISTHGRAVTLNTDGRPVMQRIACMHFSGLQCTVISPFV